MFYDGFQKVFEKAGLFINIEDYLYLAVGDTELKSTYEFRRRIWTFRG
ncbi:hypothetical protein EfmAA610_09780 [Enterococcus faecium]|nr:hypothetical protein EfmAA610_09780 [Enterococcus faecium]